MGHGIWDYDTTSIHTTLETAIKNEIQPYPLTLEEIVVFGSYGRGEATNTSDLDILIVVDTTESLSDTKRRDIFTGIATKIDEQSFNFSGPISQVDCLVSTYYNRDKVLRDCLEEVATSELQSAPCLAYSLTDEKQITVLHP